MKKKVLAIVAHPDDETIWMGGMILMNDWDTTIISLCRKSDKDRAPKFKNACDKLGAKGFMHDIEDDRLEDVPVEEFIKNISRSADKKYDIIFTHGKNGEYGHKRHIETNKAVRQMLRKKMILCKKIFFFAYSKEGDRCYANADADKFIKLSDSYLKKKRELIEKVYGFSKESFEYLCCRGEESFKEGK